MKFWKLWSAAIAGLVAMNVVGWGGGFEYLLENDKTNISIAIVVIAHLFTFYLLYDWKNQVEEAADMYWYMSDAVMSLGMIGTVLGFISVLAFAFGNLDTGNTEEVKTMLDYMAGGMSTALLTTFTGLTTSVWMKLQLVIVEGRGDA